MIPDVAPVVRDFLLTDGPVNALVADRVHILRRPVDAVYPLILLTPFAQLSVSHHIDRTVDTTLQIEGFGATEEDEATAWTVTATAQDRLRGGLISYHHADGRVSAVIPETGLQFLPDDEHHKARCVSTLRLIAY